MPGGKGTNTLSCQAQLPPPRPPRPHLLRLLPLLLLGLLLRPLRSLFSRESSLQAGAGARRAGRDRTFAAARADSHQHTCSIRQPPASPPRSSSPQGARLLLPIGPSHLPASSLRRFGPLLSSREGERLPIVALRYCAGRLAMYRAAATASNSTSPPRRTSGVYTVRWWLCACCTCPAHSRDKAQQARHVPRRRSPSILATGPALPRAVACTSIGSLNIRVFTPHPLASLSNTHTQPHRGLRPSRQPGLPPWLL